MAFYNFRSLKFIQSCFIDSQTTNVVSNNRASMIFFDILMMQMNNSNISFLLSQTRVKIIYESQKQSNRKYNKEILFYSLPCTPDHTVCVLFDVQTLFAYRLMSKSYIFYGLVMIFIYRQFEYLNLAYNTIRVPNVFFHGQIKWYTMSLNYIRKNYETPG